MRYVKEAVECFARVNRLIPKLHPSTRICMGGAGAEQLLKDHHFRRVL